MNSSNVPNVNVFDSVLSYIYRSVGIPLYISGNLGILLSAWIFHRKAWRKNVCVFYFFISLLANFININNVLLSNIFVYGFNSQVLNSSRILCKLFNYVLFLFDEFSTSILVFASIDRLLISSTNVETRLYSSKRLAYFSLSLSFIILSIYFLHALIKFDTYQFGPFISICFFGFTGFYPDFVHYSQLILNLVLYLLMIVLSIFSFKNVRKIRSIPRQQRQGIRTMHKKDFQLLRCLFTKNIVHIIGSSLIVTYTIYKAVTNSQTSTAWQQARDNFLFNLGLFIHSIPWCTDFYIYTIVSKAFRQELKRMIWKIFSQNLVRGREEDKVQDIKDEPAELRIVSTIILTN